MAKGEISIDVHSQGELRAGDRVRGVVNVHVHKDTKVNNVTIALALTTHGRGNRVNDVFDTFYLAQNEKWAAGESRQLPFDFEVPAGPATYHGHLVNIEWELQARLDVPWAIDPKAEAAFKKAPDESRAEGLIRVPEVQKNTALNFGGVPFLIGAPIFSFVAYSWLASTSINPLVALLPLLLVPFGLYLLFKPMMAKSIFEDLQFSLEPKEAQRGEFVDGVVSFVAKKSTVLNEIKATFCATETVVSGSGTDRTTHTHDVFSQEVTLPRRTLNAGDNYRERVQMRLPSDAPLSFWLSDNELQWKVVFDLDIDRWPDYKHEAKFSVSH